MTVQKESKSPMMAQYAAIKANYPGCILLYRIGDFYETFGEDAKITSKVLGIVLTRKMAGGGEYTELAGVPHHALDAYLPKLVRAGYKVAVCDQLEDPKSTKKIVKRGVTELVTPGISYNDNLLDGRENNWLACCIADKERAGIAFLDISTGAFKVSEGSLDYIDVLINDFAPKEVLLKSGSKESFKERFGNSYYLSTIDEWAFVEGAGRKRIEKQFNLNTLKGFGIEELSLGIRAAGAILFYLDMTEHKEIGHIRTISRIDKEGFVWIDKFTFRNLEIFKSLSGDEGVSLLQVMDCCASVMGARKLREWLAMPLVNQAQIKSRHDAVQAFLERKRIMAKVREDLAEIGDLERIISRASAGRITPRETLQLSRGLQRIDKIMAAINDIPEINDIISRLDSLLPLSNAISTTILADAAVQIGKGNVIASGVNAELDELRNIRDNSKDILLQIQQTERDRTGIVSLKISYNNVYGYYLEVRNTYSDKVPADWIRKQTLVSAERYVTPELKEYEEKIL
ncbi:MAG: DNA mismatch repair protein MutS, partial [Bacteroidales bacterium]|nr:DNA mismatch repair protein MutS [Bacteroidales bacterium]